jgi:MscS family membrane protein
MHHHNRFFRLQRSVVASVALLFLCLAFSWSQDTRGQDAQGQKGSVREVIEAEQAAEQLIMEKARSNIKYNTAGTTPLATMLGLREAIRRSDYAAAGEFLDMRYLPEEAAQSPAEQLVKAFAMAWQRQVILDLTRLSDDPEGNLEDGLPAYRDQIGTLVLSSGEIPVYLQRIPDDELGKVWKISNATVAEIPRIWDELGYSPAAIYLSELLPQFQLLGMSNWQLVCTVLILLLAWPLSGLVSAIFKRIALAIPNYFPQGIERFFRIPMRFFIYIMIVGQLVDRLGMTAIARAVLKSTGLDYIAFTVLLMGMLTLIRDYQIRKMERAGNAAFVALLKPMTIIIKFILVIILTLFWAESAGYNMSTLIAGLGVGSLAVALAAQKTLENMIGALTLYTAKPVSPGDFCRFGEAVGTVEEIGLRSTVIRTLDRTRVIIPNSVFSAAQIENYTERDRIRFFRNLRLQLTGAERTRFILAEIRSLLYSHPEILPDTVSVRLEKIEDATVLLRLDAGTTTTDFQVFLAVAEDLNLRIIEIVHGAGALFSGPGQSLQMRESAPESPERLAEIEATLASWRREDRLPFPNHSPEAIAELRGTLDYPPKGSPAEAARCQASPTGDRR